MAFEYTVFVFSCMLLLFIHSSAQTIDVDGKAFQVVLEDLTERSLHIKQIQDFLDFRTSYKPPVHPNGQNLLQNIVDENIQLKFLELIQAVEHLRDSVEDTLDDLFVNDGSEEGYEDCCDVTDLEEDSRYPNLQINPHKLCTVGKAANGPGVQFPKKDKILDAAKKNLKEIPEIKWQYTGFEWNYALNFPASDICPAGYQPILRSWYKETASPRPKDLVIVWDNSNSISFPDVIRDAINIVLNSLGPVDRVAVVRFDNIAETAPTNADSDCYSNKLAQALPKNLKHLVEFVNLTRPGSGSQYIPAFEKAFSFFELEDLERDKVILFVSDGKPSESREDILNTIRQKNLELHNQVVIHTFGYGIANPEVETERVELLQDIAKQENNDNTVYETRAGEYKSVETENIREIMARYFFNGEPGSEVVFSVPYHDAFGFGLIISVCAPVRNNNEFFGVTCIDVLTRDIIGVLESFQNCKGDELYTFMLDSHGLFVFHPLLPASEFGQDPPSYTDFSALEKDPSVKSLVIEPMLNGDEGEETITRERVIPRGDKVKDGVNIERTTVTYFFKQVNVGLSESYSVCVVVGNDEVFRDIADLSEFPNKINFHRADLSPDPPERCRLFNRVVYKEPVVFLTAKAFRDPSTYYSLMTIDPIDLQYIEGYLEGSPGNQFGILNSARNTVGVFYNLYDEHIKNNKENVEYTYWRYIGTVDGTFIIDNRIPTTYDHLIRPWYVEARVNKGALTITGGYRDAASNKIILTLAKALLAGRLDGIHENPQDEQMLAVIAMDFTLAQLYHHLTIAYPLCKDDDHYICMIINPNGEVILHSDLLDKPDELLDTHITQKEYGVARELIERGIMTIHKCFNSKSLRDQNFWKIELPNNQDKVTGSFFTMAKIPGTNVFVSIQNIYGGTKCRCGTKQDESSTAQCLTDPSVQNWCGCPCYTFNGEFDFCANKYKESEIGDAPAPCVPNVLKSNFEDLIELERDVVSTLPNCRHYVCNTTDKWSCEGKFGCTWCDDRICTQLDDCTPGSTKEPVGGSDDDSDPPWGVIAGVIVAVLIIVLIVGIIVYVVKKRTDTNYLEPKFVRKPPSNVTSNGPDVTLPSVPNNPVLPAKQPAPVTHVHVVTNHQYDNSGVKDGRNSGGPSEGSTYFSVFEN